MAQQVQTSLRLDEDGYLYDVNVWNVNVAEELAGNEGMDRLDAGHWKLITAIRHFYDTHGTSPLCRDILGSAGYTKERVYELFPEGHRSAYKLAGLPKPPEC